MGWNGGTFYAAFFQCNNFGNWIGINNTWLYRRMANTKRRLEILYPERHKLDINNTDDDYEITLTLLNV